MPGIKPLGLVAYHVVPRLGRLEALPPPHVISWRGDSLNAATNYNIIIIIIIIIIVVVVVVVVVAAVVVVFAVVVLPLLLVSRVSLVCIVTGLCVGRPRNRGSIFAETHEIFCLLNYVRLVIKTNV